MISVSQQNNSTYLGGKMKLNDFSSLTITDVQFLPIVKEYARRINLVDTINHMVNTEMELQPGPVVLGMVLDTLSGRSPLYRLKEFLDEKDTELLLGQTVSLEQFTDHNIGRALDNGVTKEEIGEIILHTAFYAGVPVGANAVRVAKEVFDERGI